MKFRAPVRCLALAALLSLIMPLILAAAGPDRPHWWQRLDAMARRDGYQLIRPPELKALYDQDESMAVIDARSAPEFEGGHLPRARNVEFHMGHAGKIDKAKEQELRQALGPDPKRRVVIYDRGLQCVRSQMAAQWAVSLGYENVWMLAEGWMGWAALNH